LLTPFAFCRFAVVALSGDASLVNAFSHLNTPISPPAPATCEPFPIQTATLAGRNGLGRAGLDRNRDRIFARERRIAETRLVRQQRLRCRTSSLVEVDSADGPAEVEELVLTSALSGPCLSGV
jgi:hypothetical protein